MNQQQPIKKSVRLEKPCDFCGDKIREWSGEMRCWTCNALYYKFGNVIKSSKQVNREAREKKFKAKTKKIGHSLFCFCFTFIPPIIVLYAIERTYLGDLNFISDYASWFKWGSGIWIFAGLGYAQKHDLFQNNCGD